MNAIKEAFLNIFSQISSIGVFDIADIVIVTIIFYYTYRFVRDRRAGKLAFGIILIILIMMFSRLLGMHVLSFIIENMVQVGMIGVIILFQPELRAFLEKVGGPNVFTSGLKKKDKRSMSGAVTCIDAVVDAVSDFSKEKTGAIIVFERSTKLGDVIKTGTVIDAQAVSYMIKNIFFNKAPLHDGALVIRNNRLFAAGCILPLSYDPEIIKDLGTRHRAAIGMSENSDAVVVVVSEETGTVSVAVDGKLKRDFDSITLKRELVRLIFQDQSKNNSQEAEKGGAEK